MKVLFDSECFHFLGVGGVSRYFTELIRGLEERPDTEVAHRPHRVHEALRRGDPAQLPPRRRGLDRIRLALDRRRNRRFVRRQLTRHPPDVFVPTWLGTDALPHLGETPTLAVIHDLIAEHRGLRPAEVAERRRLLARADAVVCVSRTTRDAVLRHYGDTVDPDRAHVVYHGSSLRGETREVTTPFTRFLLFVGARHGYKNFLRMMAEIAPILTGADGTGLVCVGGGPFSGAEARALDELGVGDLALQISATDAELLWLYRTATAYLSPSAEEGFGIPVVEAMGAGCTLVVNDIPVYREVAGDVARYADIGAPGAFAGAVREALAAPSPERVARGLERAGRYRWERTVSETASILAGLAGRARP